MSVRGVPARGPPVGALFLLSARHLRGPQGLITLTLARDAGVTRIIYLSVLGADVPRI
ncbi:hypothetical protein LRC39_11380 [Rhodopseudomonas sp. P1]|uniref:hypothetical protein n=1 Tax=Rhodopseudomonas sp. P1 TaxID=3434357 RepID=UPI0031FDE071